MSPRDAAASIATRLREAGFIAYFAGGCVRDRLLGREPIDYDIATSARPEEIVSLFPRAHGVGESFGVMLVRAGGRSVEVATFRRDGRYVDGRRPQDVEYGTPEQDARRRDFTINGLFEEPESGSIIDFVEGQSDLKRRVLRAIGSAEERFAEDRLRMLRAARFAARFGMVIDADTESAVRRHAGDLMGVSRERVGHEVRRMLLDQNRGLAVKSIESLGLGPAVLMEPAAALEDDRTGRLAPHASLESALAAWMLDRSSSSLGAGVTRQEAWRRALVLSNHESELVGQALALRERIDREWTGMDVAVRKRLAVAPGFRSALALFRTESPGRAEEVAAAVEHLAAGGLAPPPLVTGDDLIAMGLPPGPRFKQLLADLYDRQLRDEFSDREAALSAAREAASA